jgi:hypothetical protein
MNQSEINRRDFLGTVRPAATGLALTAPTTASAQAEGANAVVCISGLLRCAVSK